jgi:hypothetical protein
MRNLDIWVLDNKTKDKAKIKAGREGVKFREIP